VREIDFVVAGRLRGRVYRKVYCRVFLVEVLFGKKNIILIGSHFR
jgi:hypothetical protein